MVQTWQNQHHHCYRPPSMKIIMDHAPRANPRAHIPHSWSRKCRGKHSIPTNSPVGVYISQTLTHYFSTAHTLSSIPLDIWVDAAATYDASHKAVTKGLSTSILLEDNTTWKQWYAWLRMAAHVCASLQTYKASVTRSPSYKSPLTRSAQAYLQPTTSPSTR